MSASSVQWVWNVSESCFEVIWKVSLKVPERCLGGIWMVMVSGRCPESGRCRGVWRLPKGDLEGVCKVSERCLEVVWKVYRRGLEALGQVRYPKKFRHENFLVQTSF